MKNKGYAKFWGANKVRYERCESGVFQKFKPNTLSSLKASSNSESYLFKLASCLECFDKMEKAVERCKNFSEMFHCKNNVTAIECEEMKASHQLL